MSITPEKRREAYLRWKERQRLRKEGLLPPPFKAQSEEDKKWQKNKLQRERRVNNGITRVNKNFTPTPRPEVQINTPTVRKSRAKPDLKRLPKKYKKKEVVKVERLPTLKVDLSAMIPVYIPERKMTVYVKPGRDIEEVKLKYKT